MKKSIIEKLIVFAVVICLCMSICLVNADSGEAEFVNALETGINADTMWGAVIPVTGIIIFTFIFAFAYQLIKRVLKKGSRGKFGM